MGIITRIRGFFKPEKRANTGFNETIITSDQVLTSVISKNSITKEQALQIPTVKAALNLIKGTVRGIPLKLYRRDEKGNITEVLGDRRTFLLNSETGDTLNSSQMFDAMIDDYYLLGGGYSYINKDLNQIKSIHYVERQNISFVKNYDPIFKDYNILVQGKQYRPDEFFKILRDTKDGAEGVGIIKENELILKVAYNSLKFENNLVETGGNKKGFIKSAKKLAKDALETLKAAFKNLYSSNDENVVILNDGLEFQESSNTSVEMQLNENKVANAGEIAKIFNIPLGMLSGTGTSSASEDDKIKFADYCILPLLCVIENAANRDFLLESEKANMFWAFDTKDIKKGSMLERYQAYKIAVESRFMNVQEIRRLENLPPNDDNFINLGLSSVLYDPKSGKVFVPNTGETFNLLENLKKGGEVSENEDSNQE